MHYFVEFLVVLFLKVSDNFGLVSSYYISVLLENSTSVCQQDPVKFMKISSVAILSPVI